MDIQIKRKTKIDRTETIVKRVRRWSVSCLIIHMQNCTYKLNDGRLIGYAMYGPDEGKPVFYFHGTPSSRLEPLIINAFDDLNTLLSKYNIRLIAVDRPGMGLSTFYEESNFSSFAQDVFQLANHLNITTSKVLGWSGAGPFELALAYHFPELIKSVYIITGFTVSFSKPAVFKAMHANKYYFGAAKYIPFIMRPLMNVVGKIKSDKPLPHWISQLPEQDQQYMYDRDFVKLISSVTTNEACKVNSKGLVHEAQLYFREPHYQLSSITQPIHFWWGCKDEAVPKIHAEALEKEAPLAIMHYKQNEAHLSVYINYFEEVLSTIASNV